jgi:anti-anti-sigma factor
MGQRQAGQAAAVEWPATLGEVVVRMECGEALVRATGDLDHFCAPSLAEGLAQAVASGAPRTVVDLAAAEFASLSAFRALLDAADVLAASGRTMVVRCPPPSLRILHEVFATSPLVFEERGPAPV